MSVRVRSLQGGKPLPTNFSDNFNRANDNNLGPNWIRCLGGNDAVAPSSWGVATILNNQCKMQGAGFGNPNSTLKTAWLPIPMINSKVFNAPKYFVQGTFVSAANIVAFIGLRYNQSHQAGPITQDNGQDTYVCGFGGAIAKITNGGAVVTIGANNVANGTARLQVENSGTSCIITSFVNSIQINQVTELAAAFPIMQGYPCITLTLLAGAIISNAQLTLDDFSCGVF